MLYVSVLHCSIETGRPFVIAGVRTALERHNRDDTIALTAHAHMNQPLSQQSATHARSETKRWSHSTIAGSFCFSLS